MLHKRYKNSEMLSGWTSTWHRRQIPSIQLSPESALLLDYTLKMPSSSLNTSNLFYVDPLHVVLTKINLQKKNWHGRVCQRTPASTKHHSYCRSLLKNPFHFKGTLVWRHVCTAEEEIPARKQEYRKITPMIDQHSLNSFNESLLRNRKCALHTTWGDEVIKCGSGGPHQFSNRPEMIEMLEVPWQVIHARHM